MSVEFTAKYADTVDDLPAAWAFVMDYLDRVGQHPRVTISPIWTYSVRDIEDDQDPPRQFEVVVSGTVNQEGRP